MWDINRINEYIDNSIEENIHLDYKSADSLGKSDGKKKEVSKDVSAFANSDGGIIIYGINEFNKATKRHLPEKIDAVIRTDFSKEWLEQVISSNISPKINGLIITPVQYGVVENNEVIYVVEIPKSNTAHQAKDKRYNKRYNFESVAMEDYEIRDIINRSNKTDIRISLEPNMELKQINEQIKDGYPFKILANIWAYNKGNIVVQFLHLFISGNGDVSNTITEPNTENGKKFMLNFPNGEERKITVNGVDFVLGTERMPILPKTSRNIGKIIFSSEILTKDMELVLQISTEDRNRYVKLKGIQIIDTE